MRPSLETQAAAMDRRRGWPSAELEAAVGTLARRGWRARGGRGAPLPELLAAVRGERADLGAGRAGRGRGAPLPPRERRGCAAKALARRGVARDRVTVDRLPVAGRPAPWQTDAGRCPHVTPRPAGKPAARLAAGARPRVYRERRQGRPHLGGSDHPPADDHRAALRPGPDDPADLRPRRRPLRGGGLARRRARSTRPGTRTSPRTRDRRCR